MLFITFSLGVNKNKIVHSSQNFKYLLDFILKMEEQILRYLIRIKKI